MGDIKWYCQEYRKFYRWLLKSFGTNSYLIVITPFGPEIDNPPDVPGLIVVDEASLGIWVTPARINDAITRISKEYDRRCKAISSAHECDAYECIHDLYDWMMKILVKFRDEKASHEKIAEAALRREMDGRVAQKAGR